MMKMPVGCGDGPGQSTRAIAASQVTCAVCDLPADPGPGGIPIDGEWLHWTPCIAEFERARRRGDRPILPRACVLELFAQARAAGRLSAMTPELVERVAKLLRVALSNGPDGEKLAALNRLSALAAAHDLDWDAALGGAKGHDLTREQLSEVYEAGIKAGVELERQARASGGDWANAGRSRADEIGDRASDLQAILAAAAKSKADGLLDGWFANFASDMQEQVERWGGCTFVSERQWEYLEKLRSILERQDYL